MRVTGRPFDNQSAGYSSFQTGRVKARIHFITIFCSTQMALVSQWKTLDRLHSRVLLICPTVSWDAWPQGATDKTDASDMAWSAAVQPKAYMMPVSPWFYTNLPEYNKNWLWRGDDLWHNRWQQVLEIRPNFVEVID